MGGIKSDGLLGLGPSKFYKIKGERWVVVEEMKKSGVIDDAIFAIMLKKSTDMGRESSILFGAYDQNVVSNS